MADFKTAVLITLEHEGGFQKNPNDHANWSSGKIGVGTLVGTKYGITALDLPGISSAVMPYFVPIRVPSPTLPELQFAWSFGFF